jgi:copper(I)-binding protein
MLLRNPGRDDLRLVSAASDAAKSVELHETKMSGGMMQMSPVADIPVPAGKEVELKPGGLHVMMIGTTRELKVGDKINLTLTFDRGPALQVSVDVKQQ